MTDLREFHKAKKGRESSDAKVGNDVLVFDDNLIREGDGVLQEMKVWY